MLLHIRRAVVSGGLLGDFRFDRFGDTTQTRIAIYRIPLQEEFDDPGELEEEIRITVLHELAHYFGIDEDRLDELGYG